MKLSILLFSLSFSLFASFQSQFCTETSDIQKRALNQENELAFTNPSGLDLPILGDILGMPDGIGACWWHTKMQRASLYLTAFRPELPKPSIEEARELIDKIRRMKEVVIIPGFNNLREFSSEFAAIFEEIITKWQASNSFGGFRWTRAIDTNLKEKLLPDQLKTIMDDLFDEIRAGEIVFQRLPYLDDIVNHAWLVIGMHKTTRGYKLQVIDSNQIDQIPFGTSGHFETEYFYGDRYISYRDDKVVPFTDTVGEENLLKEVRNSFCEGVELIKEEDVVLVSPEMTLEIEEGVELTEEQVNNVLYQYLTMETFSYNHILYLAHMLSDEQNRISSFFTLIVDKNVDLPSYVMARMVLLARELRVLRKSLSQQMLTMIQMPSMTKEVASLMLPIVFAPSGPVEHAGEIAEIIINQFGLDDSDYKALLYGLMATKNKIENSYFLINTLIDAPIEYSERELKFISNAIYLQREELIAEHLLYKKLLRRDEVTVLVLKAVTWAIIDGRLPSYMMLLEEVVKHPSVDLKTLEHMILVFKDNWPRLDGDKELLEEYVLKHPMYGASVAKKVKECLKILREKEMAQLTIEKLDLTGLSLSTELTYGNHKPSVIIDASNLSVNDQSFILKIGFSHPMEIKVHLKNLHKIKHPRKISVIFEAPAHLFYETEKAAFDKIFSCNASKCKEKINGMIIFKDDGIELYDSDGIKGNQIKIIGSR